MDMLCDSATSLAVVPVLVGPLSTLIALLPAILMAVGAALLSLLKPAAMKKFALLLWAQKIAVLVLVGVGVGIWYAWDSVFAGPPEQVTTAEVAQREWTMFRGGPARRGFVSSEEADPGRGGENWKFQRAETQKFYASPAVVGNRVYITSADYGPLTDRGAIHAIDADSGNLVWKYDGDGYRSTFSSPSIVGDRLVVGEGLHETRDARIVCIDLARSERERAGFALWNFRTASHVESSPCISEGHVYIGAGDDGVYCLALEPDEQGEAQVVWHLAGDAYPDAESSPIVADGKVYFGLGEGGKAICCVDAATGKEIWRVATPYPVFGCPTITGDRLYVGMGNGNFVETAEIAALKIIDRLRAAGRTEAEIDEERRLLGPIGEVWSLDLATGEPAWKFPVERTILGAVAAADERLYFGSRDGHVYCVSREGKLIHRWNARAPMVTSPAVAREHVYFVTQAGVLHCLDRDEFEPVWEMRIDSGGESFGSPVVARGHVYVGTSGNGLKSIGQPGREEEEPRWIGALGGPGRSGWDGSLVPSRGKLAWRYPSAPRGRRRRGPGPEAPTITAPAAHIVERVEKENDEGRTESVEVGHAYVGMTYTDRRGIASLNCGANRGDDPELRWFHETELPVAQSAAATRDFVYCVTGHPGDDGRRLLCLAAATGKKKWDHPVASNAAGHLVLTAAGLLIADEVEGLSRIVDEGEAAAPARMWTTEVGDLAGPVFEHGSLVIAAAKDRLSVLDAPTGRVLWSADIASRTGPIVTGEDGFARIWVGGAEGAGAFRLLDGKQVAAVECGAVSSPIVSQGERLACTTAAEEIVVFDAETAAVLRRIPGANPGFAPLFAKESLLFVGDESLRIHDMRNGETREWMKLFWREPLTGAPTMIDSHVYFAIDKKGFVCAEPSNQ